MGTAPVAIFVYNRLDTAIRVFSRVAEARPPVLLVIADGPRDDRPDDFIACAAVREIVCNPTWKCDLRLNISNRNLGLGARFSSGLKWVFEEVEHAIILEDDCLPDPTFFPYCEELLQRYADDPRIMMISGDNYQSGRIRGPASYFCSHGVGTYGWATWDRAFALYDFQMRDWPTERNRNWLSQIWPAPDVAAYWRERFDETHAGYIDTWDYQWAFAMWRHNGMQVSPQKNLVSYIGCLPDAVHTVDASAPYCNQPTQSMDFPLVHPTSLRRNLAADVYEFYRIFLNKSHAEAIEAELTCPTSET